MLNIAYDLTPYVKNPYGGISRVCYNTFMQAHRHTDITPTAFSDSKGSAVNLPATVLNSTGKKYFGKKYNIAHSLNHRLLTVKAEKKVYTVHDVWSLRPNKYQPHAFQKKLAARITRDLQQADMIISISETTHKNLLDLNIVDPAKCRYALLGCEHMQITELVGHDEIKALLTKKYVLYVGCLEVRKNIEHLLKAVAPFEDVMLVIAGSPGYGYEDISKQIDAFPSDRLFHLKSGSRNLLAHLYANAVALLLPSWEEGFGLPIVEAMSVGCPVITSNQSANAEIGGEGAMLVDPSKPDESTTYLRKLMDDEAFSQQQRDAALKRSQYFSWERYYELLVAMYKTLL